MFIEFSTNRWDNIRNVYSSWWNRTLQRPVVNLTFTGAKSDMEKPEDFSGIPLWKRPLDEPIEKILRDDLYTVSTGRFAADAFPMVLPDFGAGVNAAFCGCIAIPMADTVWFHPPGPGIDPRELQITHCPESTIYHRIRQYYEKSADFFEGQAVIGMTHLNNGIDIVARFFDGESMILALRDYPEEIKRLTNENHHLFVRYLEELSASMGDDVPGYSCWGNIYGERPWFGTQSDFCYMIGPDDFNEFVLPELTQCYNTYGEANYYHLDGPEQLRHLDTILTIPNLKCVQWVSGAGAPAPLEWPEVYKKIAGAGKNIWYMGELSELIEIANIIGTTSGLYWQGYWPWERREEARKLLRELGVPEEF